MNRPTNDEIYLQIAELIAKRGTCIRRQVGCVLVDKRGRVLSMGYNGVPSGRAHCTDIACPGAGRPSGTGLSDCEAIHAEQNAVALLDKPAELHTAYVTVTPCTECVKLLLATPCQRIVCRDEYPHPIAMRWWADAGRELQVLKSHK